MSRTDDGFEKSYGVIMSNSINKSSSDNYRKALAVKSLYHALAGEHEKSESIREFLRDLAIKDQELALEAETITSESPIFAESARRISPEAFAELFHEKREIAKKSLIYAIKQDNEKSEALRYYLRSMSEI